MSKKQASRSHPEQDVQSAKKPKLRFTVAKVETPIPPGGFIYSGCICNSLFQEIRRSAVQIP